MDANKIAAAVKMLIEGIGDDPSRSDLVETPRRVVAVWESFAKAQATFDGELLGKSFLVANYDNFIIVKNIVFSSFCDHHLLPFFGKISVAYIPVGGTVVGISKLARIVDKYSKRLQLQERLTQQILGAISENVANDGVLVIVSARHMCMAARGVMQPGSETITRAISGNFAENGTLVAEAQQLIFGSDGKEF
jgi:GTP cyclohydrolase I